MDAQPTAAQPTAAGRSGPRPEAAFLGLDLGTTAVKALAAAPDGRTLWSLAAPLSMSAPRPAWAEQDPEDWWAAVKGLLRSVPRHIKVERLGLSGQMHTLVPLGSGGRVLRPAILWCDQRTAGQCAGATGALGGEGRVIALTGNPIFPGFTLPKILWLKEREPEVFSRLQTALIAKDWIAWRLTGELGAEPSDASGSAMFDVAAGAWSRTVMEALGLDPSMLPPVTESSGARGRLRAELAAELGWDRIEVAAGAADNAASALGLGLTGPGDCMVSIGTSGTVLSVARSPIPDPSGRIHLFRHALPGAAYHMGVMLSATTSLGWFKAMMAPDASWAELEAEMAAAPPGGDGLLWLPYLQGERAPHRDPDARGVLFGLSAMTDRARTLRAVMEGVTFGLRDCFELVKGLAEINNVLVVGGGASNKLWRRILAANLRTPVAVPAADEGAAYGAAMLAALGAGLGLDEVKAWVGRGPATEPDPADVERYGPIYEQFRALYGDLAGRFKAVARL
jgi:xylulokinase